MSHTQHTPGPWVATKDQDGCNEDWMIGPPDGKPDLVAVCSKRDARLIATAPRLLSAAKRVTAAFRAMGQPASVIGLVSNLRAECEASMLELDEAIKQATGDGE